MAIISSVCRLWKDRSAQDLTEYAILFSLIAIVCVVGVLASGSSVDTYWTGISTVMAAIPGA